MVRIERVEGEKHVSVTKTRYETLKTSVRAGLGRRGRATLAGQKTRLKLLQIRHEWCPEGFEDRVPAWTATARQHAPGSLIPSTRAPGVTSADGVRHERTMQRATVDRGTAKRDRAAQRLSHSGAAGGAGSSARELKQG